MQKAMDEGINLPAMDAIHGDAKRFSSAYRVLDDAIRARAFPGCAFGVIALGTVEGEILFKDVRGRFTFENDSAEVTPETVYDVASLTKVLATTAMAMLLSQRGLLEVDMPIGDLLPEFVAGRNTSDPARQVTVRHLLAHNSGLPGYVEFFRSVNTPATLYEECLKLPLDTPPGTRAVYSDPGFILLGKALEAIVREPLDKWVQREIFQPLAMTATGFCPRPETRLAIPPTEENRFPGEGRIQGVAQDENARVLGGVAGHAGLFSNVADILRFAREVLCAGHEAAKPHLFEASTIRAFAQRQNPPGSSRALGWDTPSENSSSGNYFSRHSVGHLGYSGCSLWIDLDAELAVMLLTNRTWPDRKNEAIRQVRPAFHNALRGAI
jgi:serine-type D-Ala-D-Ala carboxypeptidase